MTWSLSSGTEKAPDLSATAIMSRFPSSAPLMACFFSSISDMQCFLMIVEACWISELRLNLPRVKVSLEFGGTISYGKTRMTHWGRMAPNTPSNWPNRLGLNKDLYTVSSSPLGFLMALKS